MRELFVNREISWLSFNERVLQEAQDQTVPLLQRIRFLGIFSNNLDEFFKVRVATLKRMLEYENFSVESYGHSPRLILNEIQNKVIEQQNKFENTYSEILRELSNHRIYILDENELSHKQLKYARKYFRNKVITTIVPLMISKGEKFPDLKEESIYLAVKLCRNGKKNDQYALIEVPTKQLSRFVELPDFKKNKYIILLEDVIRVCLKDVFAILNYNHYESYIIKITRDAELDIDNDVTKSFLENVSSSIIQRSKAQAVRLVYDKTMPKDMIAFFKKNMRLDDNDSIIPGGRYHNFKDFMNFPEIGAKRLRYTHNIPLHHPNLKSKVSSLEVIKKQDILLHYPYQRFSHFIDLLREAAIDPKVKSIKITAYRLAKNSKVINALINAAKNQKKVTVVIELQARFDEKDNVEWSRQLMDQGVKVIFGVPQKKVHCKLLLIARKEDKKHVLYAGVGTGNFHEVTAGIYSDLMLLTSNQNITKEVDKLFNFLSDIFIPSSFKYLLVAPLNLRNKLLRLINNEILFARAGKKAGIILKLNSLVDRDVIRKLYHASKAGVKITLIVRGICSLLPDVAQLSENIKAVSIVDKFLEHSRIFIFTNNGDEQIYISSADMMTRNFDHRIEVACPILDKKIKQEIKDLINIQLNDNVKSRIIDEEQKNEYIGRKGNEIFRSQDELYNYYEKMLP